MKGVIYTAIFGGHDQLKPQPHAGAPCVAFVRTVPRRSPAPWQVIPRSRSQETARREARWHKAMPHVLFPDHDCSLWIDGSIELTADFLFSSLAERYLGRYDAVFFAHSHRRCLYEEAEICMRFNLDDPRTIEAQIARYREAGFPRQQGLLETGMILRRHTPAIARLNEAWWQETLSGSHRDQISLPYVLRATGIDYALFPQSIRATTFLTIHPHRFVERAPNTFRDRVLNRYYKTRRALTRAGQLMTRCCERIGLLRLSLAAFEPVSGRSPVLTDVRRD